MLPEIKLKRSDVGRELFPFMSEDDRMVIGHRNKIGGAPDWIQSDETPVCPVCHKKMDFYAQIDSINSEFRIGDVGMRYVFSVLIALKRIQSCNLIDEILG